MLVNSNFTWCFFLMVSRNKHANFPVTISQGLVHFIVVTCTRGLRAYISGKSRVPMLQVLCNTSGEADNLNANTRVISEFFIYACLNNSIMVKCG